MRIALALCAVLALALVACDEPEPGVRDISVTSVDSPSGDVANGATVEPAATVKNRSDTAATFDAWMFLDDPADARAYVDSLKGETLAADESRQLVFGASDPLTVAGSWTARCSVAWVPDTDPANNTASRAFTVGAPKDVVDLVPGDNEISGWARSGAMKIAENETQLYDLINGEGVVYVENGFLKCAFQDFQGDIGGSTVDLELRVFDQGLPANAEAVYDATGTGAETPWTEGSPGDEARIDESLLFAYKVEFRSGRFFAWITIVEKSDAALGIAKLFALNVAGAIGK